MEKGKKTPGSGTKAGQSTRGRRGRKPQADKQVTPTVSKIQRKRAKKTDTATEANITDFFPKETLNDDTDNETGSEAPLLQTSSKNEDRVPEIKSRVKRKSADVSILQSQGTPFHVVHIQAEVYPDESSSKVSGKPSVSIDRSMGSRLSSVIGNKSAAERTTRRTSTSGQSPYFQRGQGDSNSMDTDGDTDGSLVFDKGGQERTTRSGARGGRVKTRPVKEVSTTEEGSENEHGSRSNSPDLFMSPKLPPIWVEEKQKMVSPHTVRDDGNHGDEVDDDETQLLTPVDDVSAEETETAKDQPTNESHSQGLKRKEPGDDLDLPVPKRRPVVFDFEPMPSEQCSNSQDSPLAPLKKLVNKKRLRMKYVDPRPRMFAPKGSDPKKYARMIVRHFEDYREGLRDAQSRQSQCLSWGRPVVVGRHCAGTLDKMVRGQDLITNYSSQKVDNGSDEWTHVPTFVEKQRRVVEQGVKYVHQVLPPQDGQPKGPQIIQLIPVPAKYVDTKLSMEGGRSQGNLASRLPRRILARKAAVRSDDVHKLFATSDSDEENEFQSIPKVRKRTSKKDDDEDYVPDTQDMAFDFNAAGTLSQAQSMGHMQKLEDSDDDAVTVVPDSQSLSPPVAMRKCKASQQFDDATLQSASSQLTAQFSNKLDAITKKVSASSKTMMYTADLEDSGSNYDDVFAGGDTSKTRRKISPNSGESRETRQKTRQNSSPPSKTTRKRAPRKKKQPPNMLDNDFFEFDSGNEGANSKQSGKIGNKVPKNSKEFGDDLVVVDDDDTDVPDDEPDPDRSKTEEADEANTKMDHAPTEQPASARKRLGLRVTRQKVQDAQRAVEDEKRPTRDGERKTVAEPKTPVDRRGAQLAAQVTPVDRRGAQPAAQVTPVDRRGAQPAAQVTPVDRRGAQPAAQVTPVLVIVPPPQSKKVEKLVECPMCYKKFTESQIEPHAYTCEGEKPEESDSGDDNEPEAPIGNIQIQTLFQKKNIPLTVVQPNQNPRPGPSQQASQTRDEGSQKTLDETLPSSSRVKLPRVATAPTPQRTGRSAQMLTDLPATVERKDVMPLPSVKIATNACPMCSHQVPVDGFEKHVTACVDNAEAMTAMEKGDVQEVPEIDTLIKRPARRRALHPDQT